MELEQSDIVLAVTSGWLDDHLDEVAEAINRRKRYQAEERVSQLIIGDIVRISQHVRPKAMAGLLAEVVDLKEGQVWISLQETTGLQKWDRMSKIGLPHSLVGEVLPRPPAQV